MDKDYGHLLKERKINKYQLSHKAEMNWKQINNYCNNDITRLDTFVLCKLCTVLECNIYDLLVFIPADMDQK